MRKLSLILVLSLLFAGLCLAHGEEKTGILVDAKCGVQVTKSSEETAKHTVACALGCKDSGFGIVVDGEFLKFDDYGNKLALMLLKATDKESNLKVRVGGYFEGSVAKVSELETVD